MLANDVTIRVRDSRMIEAVDGDEYVLFVSIYEFITGDLGSPIKLQRWTKSKLWSRGTYLAIRN